MHYTQKSRSINCLLILSVLIHFLALCTQALDLKRSLSFVGLNNEQDQIRVNDLAQYADDSLITQSGKSNKVSKLMRFFHGKAGDVIYGKDKSDPHLGDHDENTTLELDSINRTDDEVIMNACNNRPTKTCKLATKIALKYEGREKAAIANSLRHKPVDVDGSRVLYHKLFEAAIAKTEETGLDEKIDFGIDLLAKRNPYGWAASKALNMAAKI